MNGFAASLTLLALFLLFPVPAPAGDFSAIVNGKSFHLGASRDWNEDNYGLGVEYEFSSRSRWKKRLMASGFRDSNDTMSYIAGGGLHRTLFASERLRGLYIDAGINAFLMTRKDVNDNAPFPGILPSITVGAGNVGVNLTYLPKLAVEKMLSATMADDSIDGIVFLQLKFRIGANNGSR